MTLFKKVKVSGELGQLHLVLNGDSVPDSLAAYATRQWQRFSVQLWVNQERPSL